MSEAITKALQDVPVVSDDILIEREYERVMGQHLRPQDRAGVLKVCRAILAMRPAVEPMTPEQRDTAIDAKLAEYGYPANTRNAALAGWYACLQALGITAKAEGGA